ncbi:hypothetical protein D3C74_281390 [compost metagenome]
MRMSHFADGAEVLQGTEEIRVLNQHGGGVFRDGRGERFAIGNALRPADLDDLKV